jgi:hypothetical protein
MGKSVQIVTFARPRAGFVRIEIDRSLSGTGHESYESAPNEESDRPTDVLAKRLFETGLVKRVHIFSNVITITEAGSGVDSREVEPATGSDARATMEESEEHVSEKDDTLRTVVEQLFVHYRPGILPTPV